MIRLPLNGDPISSSDANSKDGKDETTASLKSQSWLNTNLSWDFTDIWKIKPNEYPTLIAPAKINLVIPEVSYGTQISLSATSDNNAVPIAYTSSDNTVAEISGMVLIARKAGNVIITASQPASDGFFAGRTSVILTIRKKTLTVTANPAAITYGDALPQSYSCLYSGFANGETESVLTQLPLFTCSATSWSTVGEYLIIPSGASAQNYSFNYTNGTLTVTKRNLQVTPGNTSRTYGNSNPPFTLSYSGFVNGNTEASILIKPTAATAPPCVVRRRRGYVFRDYRRRDTCFDSRFEGLTVLSIRRRVS
jgi:hypothetical protein